MRRMRLLEMPNGRRVAKRFVEDSGLIPGGDVTRCASEFAQMARVPVGITADYNTLREFLTTKYSEWLRGWPKRQNGKRYGKYAGLRGNVANSGIMFNTRIHRPNLAAQVINCQPYHKQRVSLAKLTRDALRIKKQMNNSTVGVMVKTISSDVDLLPELYKRIDSLVEDDFTAELQDIQGYGELFRRFGARGSHRGVYNYCLPAKMIAYIKKRGSVFESDDDLISELTAKIKLAIENYGVASTVIYLADLGKHYNLSESTRTNCQKIAAELLSRDEARIQYAIPHARALRDEIRSDLGEPALDTHFF